MSSHKLQKRCAHLLEAGELVVAAAKATPRGAAHETILGAAGAVAGGTASPALAGAGAVLGSQAAAPVGEAGRAERDAAGLDVGTATQVLLTVTDRRIVLIRLSALGKPKSIEASLDRAQVQSVAMGETKLFGQKMAEIVLTTSAGAQVGFGVAKVHRKDGDAVVAALS